MVTVLFSKLWFIFALMVFLHIVDDYMFQGVLSKLKQKSFWKNDPIGKDPMYKFDYIVALVCHAISWTFMIMLPVIIYIYMCAIPVPTVNIIGAYVMNIILHAAADDLKANRHAINLVQDQCFHLLQIVASFLLCIGW